FGSQLDISRRREAEEALHQAQKMEAVGKLTGGIAHDFNNLLQVILGYVDILEARVGGDNSGAQRAIEAIGAAATRGATLTQQLLAFARKQELSDRLLNMSSLISDFAPIIDRTIGEGIMLERQLDDNLWNCRVDPVQAEMALINILTNARDALNGSGRITVSTRNVVLPGDEQLPDKLDDGEYVVVSVTDNGPGIDSDIIDRIFDPFFSTKEVGKGTGLGLAMVYGFMRQSGGVAIARNRPEGGAEFLLYFPRSTGAVDRKAPHARAAEPGGAERILMVEDQEDVAQLARTLLEDLGYSVVHVSSARAALDLLARDSDFRLLFTDIIMPGGMNGVGLAQQVRRDYPHMAVLLTTGFADDAFHADGAQSFELIRKPYRRAELDMKMRAVLDRPGART
ncbi:MAG: ATP-binding protein, partial [Sphingomonas sp.]